MDINQTFEEQLSKRYKKNTNEKKIIFSIIIPIYNVEEYLEETLDSIINQTLDFEKHVQIILVNDGSPDNSEEICLRYRNKYPSNILYIKKENGGVSSARNAGIEYAEGEYINFLDSDDVLEKDVLEKVYHFFTSHRNQVDVVCLPIYYFEARKGEHLLNYKFDETKIIDIEESPNKIQLHVSSAFITKEKAKSYRFDENLKYGEDAKYVNEIILDKGKYGILNNTKYYYRIRKSQTSAIQTSRFSKAWYNESLVYFSKALIQMGLDKWGYVPKYLQHIIMYDLQWKIKIREIPDTVLSEEEKKEFISHVKEVLQYIDDDVIFAQRYINIHMKIFAIKLKYLDRDYDILSYLKFQDTVKIYINGRLLSNLKKQQVYLNIVEISGSKITIEGMFASAFNEWDCKILVAFNGKEVPVEKVSRPLNDIKAMGIKIKEVYGFKTVIDASDLKGKGSIEFFVTYDNLKIPLKYELTHLSPFTKRIPSYFAKDKLIMYPGKKKIIVVPNTFIRHLKKEAGMVKRLIKLGKKKSGAPKAIFSRLLYHCLKPFVRKPIYIFMDRVDKADDNAEVLFRYANSKKDGIKKYFILTKESKDFPRMKQYGKVIPYGSYRHKLLLLLCDKLISSHADDIILNPFGSTKIYYKDLLTFDFVFLQHGITQNDLSDWLYKYKKNIKLFVTAAHDEHKSIVNGDYAYTDQEVKCLGLPRHDRLINENKKQILIMPTWRKNITPPLDANLKRKYSEKFVETKYFEMYNGLLNHKDVLNKAKELGYNIKFVIHPILKEQISDFKGNEIVEIVHPDHVAYFKLFNESSLLITDYSSVAFDFAYLRKPVIYFQFDKEEFHGKHLSKGYFDYEKHGFGPVKSTLEDVAAEIVKTLDNGCKLSDFYRERIDQFFVYSDQKNSERVYNEIKKMTH